MKVQRNDREKYVKDKIRNNDFALTNTNIDIFSLGNPASNTTSFDGHRIAD
jgi:hypothetical protein